MAVIVIINHIGERSCTGIRCTNQSEGTLITLLVQFRSSTLYPQTISLAHLLSGNSTGESSHIRPNITVVSVYFIYFITADHQYSRVPVPAYPSRFHGLSRLLSRAQYHTIRCVSRLPDTFPYISLNREIRMGLSIS